MLDLRQKLFLMSLSIGLIGFLFLMIHQKKMKENYAFLWFLMGMMFFFIIVWFEPVRAVSEFLHIISPANFLFFLSLFFLFVVCIHFSVMLSHMSTQIKNLAQKNALLENRLRRSSGKTPRS